ncbi:MAG: Flp pilus assembly protein TadG [Paracoccaceae bacterium]|jgi:Flp pilus assembly protein TadG
MPDPKAKRIAIKQRLIHGFVRDESGSLIIFSLFMFLAMVAVGGLALDVLRYENIRTQLQNTTDAATLAAANLNNIQVPNTVVEEYFAKAELSQFLTDVKVTQAINSRRVSASAEVNMRTSFMRFSGIETLPITTLGTAQQDAGDIEIAIVLDVSGSMIGSKTSSLKTAAKNFIDTVLPTSDIPDEERPTVSLVPYNDMINLGADYGPYFNLDTSHSYSWCARLQDSVFATTFWDTALTVERIAHFDRVSTSSATPLPNPQCPTGALNAPLLHATDPQTLKDHIDALTPTSMGWTAISLGAKFGAALLDPSTRPITNAMVEDQVLVNRALNLPKAFISDAGVTNSKILVLMTDGANTLQRDLKQKFKSGASNVYYAPVYENYYRNSVSASFAVYSPERAAQGNRAWWFPYYGSWYWNNPFDSWGVSNTRLSNLELFAMKSIVHIGRRIYTSNVPGYTEFIYYNNGNAYANAYESYIDDDMLDDQSRKVCDAAKAAGMIVFTVAFEAPWDGTQLMSYCASTPAHYYEVDGDDIVLAFEAIGRNINQLKLTQ